MEEKCGKKKAIKAEGIIYGLIFLLALFLRVYRLNDLPYGIHMDEAGMGYDAYSLANWGLDRYYKFYPVYFINFGGGQSVLYGYSCAFLLKFFKLSVTLLRTPAVISGMMTWLFGTLLIKENIGRRAGIAGSLLLAVCPCFILISRLGMDCFWFSGMASVSLYCLTKAIQAGKSRKATVLYVTAGVLLGISLYTYALSWLVIPLSLMITILYLLYEKKITWLQIAGMGVPLALLAAPLIALLIINTFKLPEIATVHFTIPRLPEYRGAEVSLKNVINNIPKLFQTLFFYDEWRYNSVLTWFSMYVLSVPFSIYGMMIHAKDLKKELERRECTGRTVVWFWVIAQICMGLSIEGPNVNKLNGVYVGLLFFTVLGLKTCLENILSEKGKRIFISGTAAVYAIFAVSFIHYYFTQYTQETHPLYLFCDTYEDILENWKDVIGDKTVYSDSSYIFYALGKEISPMELQLVEKGSKSRDHVQFGLPKEVDENGFYLLFWNQSEAETLAENGFTIEEAGKFTIAYKN